MTAIETNEGAVALHLAGALCAVEPIEGARRGADDVGVVGVDDTLDAFAHEVAHDLRAPVRTARLLADRLVADVADDLSERGSDLAARLDTALAQMDHMILSMLDYASGTQGTTPIPTDVGDAVHTAASLVEADALVAGGRITTSGSAVVTATPTLLVRVIQNLLTNALKYARPDAAPTIAVTTTAFDGEAHIVVEDNGLGIPACDRERVFQLLERLEPERASGSGFGLPICRRIIRGFGGDITIAASDTPGTRVHVRLPLALHPEHDCLGVA